MFHNILNLFCYLIVNESYQNFLQKSNILRPPARYFQISRQMSLSYLLYWWNPILPRPAKVKMLGNRRIQQNFLPRPKRSVLIRLAEGSQEAGLQFQRPATSVFCSAYTPMWPPPRKQFKCSSIKMTECVHAYFIACRI